MAQSWKGVPMDGTWHNHKARLCLCSLTQTSVQVLALLPPPWVEGGCPPFFRLFFFLLQPPQTSWEPLAKSQQPLCLCSSPLNQHCQHPVWGVNPRSLKWQQRKDTGVHFSTVRGIQLPLCNKLLLQMDLLVSKIASLKIWSSR